MSETSRGENLENQEEHLRNIDLYDLMEEVSTFQGNVLFSPAHDSLHRIPEKESMSAEEKFESLQEANEKLLADVGLSLEIFIDKEEIDRGVDEVKDATVHVASPDQFVKYLKSVDGASITPRQAVGLTDLIFKLRWNLISHYDLKKPNDEALNYFKVLSDIRSQIDRIYNETTTNQYAENGGSFYFFEQPEKEGETPMWHLGEDFKWSDMKEESIRAQELAESLRGKYLKEYLMAYGESLAPSDISKRDFFDYESTINLIESISKNPRAQNFVKGLINQCRDRVRDFTPLEKEEKKERDFDKEYFLKRLEKIEKELEK